MTTPFVGSSGSSSLTTMATDYHSAPDVSPGWWHARGAPGGTRTHISFVVSKELSPIELPGRSHTYAHGGSLGKTEVSHHHLNEKRSGRMTTPFVGSPMAPSTLTKTTPVYHWLYSASRPVRHLRGAPGGTRTHILVLVRNVLSPIKLPGRSHNLRAILEAGQ